MSPFAFALLAVVAQCALLYVGQPRTSASASPVPLEHYLQLLKRQLNVTELPTPIHDGSDADAVARRTLAAATLPAIVMQQYHEHVLELQLRLQRAANYSLQQQLKPPQQRHHHQHHHKHHHKRHHHWRHSVYSYTHEDDGPLDQQFVDRPDKLLFRFDVTNIPRSHKTTGDALLQINYRTPAANDTTSASAPTAAAANCTIGVYDILRPGQKFTLIAALNVSTDAAPTPTTATNSTGTGSRLELNVRSAVKRWRRDPLAMYGLVVQIDCTDAGPLAAQRLHQRIRLRRSATESDADWAQHQPTLTVPTKHEIQMRPRTAKPNVPVPVAYVRTRRQAAAAAIAPAAPAASAPAAGAPALPATNTTVAGRQTCRMQPMYVDFAAIGWSDWIVAPHGFESNFCHGQCRLPRDQHPTNHALIQAEINRIAPHMAPAPCCVPTRYDPISVIYVGSKHQFLTTEFPRMVATQCGCR